MKSYGLDSVLAFLNDCKRISSEKGYGWYKKYGLLYLLCAKDHLDEEIKRIEKDVETEVNKTKGE